MHILWSQHHKCWGTKSDLSLLTSLPFLETSCLYIPDASNATLQNFILQSLHFMLSPFFLYIFFSLNNDPLCKDMMNMLMTSEFQGLRSYPNTWYCPLRKLRRPLACWWPMPAPQSTDPCYSALFQPPHCPHGPLSSAGGARKRISGWNNKMFPLVKNT